MLGGSQMKMDVLKKNVFKCMVCVFVFGVLSVVNYSVEVFAKTTDFNINGKYYEFDKGSHYEIADSTAIGAVSDSLGDFSISGDAKEVAAKGEIPSFGINDGIIEIRYKVGSTYKGEDTTKWHIIEDKSKTVDDMKLDENILKGAIIVQTSLTGENWITDKVFTNVVGDVEFDGQIYSSKEIQQINGCYFRVVVVYYLRRQLEDKKIVFFNVDNYEYKKCAEEYVFYLENDEDTASETVIPSSTPKMELGSVEKKGKDNGFSGQEDITKDDPHFGWDIGTFFVNGYTREQPVATGEDPIFLKTVGDKVTLWFNLTEDISCLNGNEKIIINEDKNAYDQYFGVEQSNFKHGSLIIRYTDYENKRHDPVIYTDYLAANARTGANTKVELFEEGNYEVALDYEIKDSSGITPKYTNYQIFFKFKIRNGNCMAYPFDIVTGHELSDNALTENGFRLDLAKSRYLIIDIVRNGVKKENDRYSLDVRVSTATQEGKEYTTEGIYTFTAKNPATGDSQSKTIYVGNSAIYKALAKYRTLEEINFLLDQGGQLQDDGSILMPVTEEEKTEEEEEKTEEEEESEENVTDVVEEKPEKRPITLEGSEPVEPSVVNEDITEEIENEVPGLESTNITLFVIAGIIVALIVSVALIVTKKTKGKSANRMDGVYEENGREDEQQ